MEALVSQFFVGASAGVAHVRGAPGSKWDATVQSAAACNSHNAARSPSVAVAPRSAADVAAAVKLAAAARAQGLAGVGDDPAICVCGGGHTELSVRDGAVLVHLRALASIEVDAEAGTVTAGTGVTLGELAAAAAKHNLAVPVGLYPTVGAGLMLQGGNGRLTRSHSVCVDNIVGAELVSADGEVIVVDAQTDPELLFGIRGAAPNLGVVTRLTLMAYPMPERVLFGRRTEPLVDAAAAAAALAAAEPTIRRLPRDQMCDSVFWWAEDGPKFGLFPLSLGDEYSKADMEGLGVGPASFRTCAFSELPYDFTADPDAPPAEDGSTAQSSPGVYTYVRQCYVDHLGEDGWRTLANAALAAPSHLSTVMLQHGGGAVRDVDPDSSAFRCRQWEHSVVLISMWTENTPENFASNKAWADGIFDAMKALGLVTGCYAVDIDRFRRKDVSEEVAAAFGANLPRLRALKQRMDPDNLFSSTVPLVAPSAAL